MRRFFRVLVMVAAWAGAAEAGQEVTISPGVSAILTEAKGAPGERRPAVVLLHSKGGWEWPVTQQYVQPLTEAGFTVLEPRMFRNGPAAPPVLSMLPVLYDALKWLAARDDVDATRIGVAGFSYGGSLSLHAAASWAQAEYAKDPKLRFAAHAPFYPVCWAFAAFAQGGRKTPGLPADAFASWTGAPVRIFVGDKDDYDGQDPDACTGFVASLPEGARGAFAVRVYPGATHGWDQKPAEFFEKSACKGAGCINHNIPNPEVTRQGIAELVAFFKDAMK